MVSAKMKAKVLERAAEILARPGRWVQGMLSVDLTGHGRTTDRLKTDEASYCSLGAIYAATKEHGLTTAYDQLGTEFGQRLISRGLAASSPFDSPAVAVANYNDAPGRTQEEVVKAMRSMACEARQQAEGEE